MCHPLSIFCFFFFNDTATTEIYTLSLHDALPISERIAAAGLDDFQPRFDQGVVRDGERQARDDHIAQRFTRNVHTDRKSTRLNSSHSQISYAVFCLKKKKKNSTRPSHAVNVTSLT